MTEYNYDRSDIFPPDFRDDYRVRYFDYSRAENEYFEYFREQQPLRREDRSQYEYNQSRISSSTKGLYGFGYGRQEQQIDQNDDDMSQLGNIGPNRPNPFNLYQIKKSSSHWF